MQLNDDDDDEKAILAGGRKQWGRRSDGCGYSDGL
jgi:hypothetical protein